MALWRYPISLMRINQREHIYIFSLGLILRHAVGRKEQLPRALTIFRGAAKKVFFKALFKLFTKK